MIKSHDDHKQLKFQWLSSKQDSILSVSPVKLIKFIALGSQPGQAALIKASHPANGPDTNDSDQLGLFPTAVILHFFQCLCFQTPTFLISRLHLYKALIISRLQLYKALIWSVQEWEPHSHSNNGSSWCKSDVTLTLTFRYFLCSTFVSLLLLFGRGY